MMMGPPAAPPLPAAALPSFVLPPQATKITSGAAIEDIRIGEMHRILIVAPLVTALPIHDR
jgi:hypothetical protein